MNGRSNGAEHVDEGTVHAWLDGQLSTEEAARVETHVAGCDVCSALVAEARGHIAAAARIVNALDGVPTRVVPQARRRSRQWQLRIAAAIVVMAVGTAVLLRDSHGRVSPPFEERVAAPAAALQSQSAPNARSLPSPATTSTLKGKEQQQSSALAKKVPTAPPTNKAAAKAAPISPAAVGGLRQQVNRERDLTESLSAHSSALKQCCPVAGDTVVLYDSLRAQASPPPSAANSAGTALSVPRAMARLSPMAPAAANAPEAPTVENALQGKPSDQVAAPPALASNARTITGRVVDGEQRAPVPAAQVLIPGTVIGQSTTDSGTFNIAVPANAKSLTVRRIGYLAETVPLKPGTTDYTIPLKKDVLRLESQVVTGVATSASTQDAAHAVTILTAPQSAGAVARQNGSAAGSALQITLNGSRCQGRVVRVPTSAEFTDSTDALLTSTPSQSLDQAGFVARFVPDTTTTAAGSWQPIGRDSALVSLQGPRASSQSRVSCGENQP